MMGGIGGGGRRGGSKEREERGRRQRKRRGRRKIKVSPSFFLPFLFFFSLHLFALFIPWFS
jgi:hypothetical protein